MHFIAIIAISTVTFGWRNLKNCYFTRGHSLKLQKRKCRSSVRQILFSYRIVNFWNSLPESVVTAPTLNCFKNRIDKHCIALKFSYTLWTSTTKISKQAYSLYTTEEDDDDADDDDCFVFDRDDNKASNMSTPLPRPRRLRVNQGNGQTSLRPGPMQCQIRYHSKSKVK